MLLSKTSLHLHKLFIAAVCMLMAVLYGCNGSGNNTDTDSLSPSMKDTVSYPQHAAPATVDSSSNRPVPDTGDKTGQMPPPPTSD